MSQIDTAFINTFRSGFDFAMQQRTSRLEPYTRVESQHSEFDYYDRVGALEANEVTTRWADTVNSEITHDRRQAHIRDFDLSTLVAPNDLIRMGTDPSSVYMKTLIMGHLRKKDDVIIEAFGGTAKTGKAGATSVTFPTGNIIATTGNLTGNSYGVPNLTDGSASNLTPSKLRTAKLILDRATETFGEEGEPHLFICDPIQIASLLSDVKVTSADYNTVRALVAGDIDTYMGFKFIRSTRLTKATNTRTCYAFIKSAVLLAKGSDITVDISVRNDKRNAIQIYTKATYGATRLWEEGVVQILCDESIGLTSI